MLLIVMLGDAMLWNGAARAGAAIGSEIGPRQMEGVRTTRDGRGLVLVFIGGRPYRATDPCSVRYSARVRETRREVNVVVHGQGPPDSPPVVACTLEGYSRTLTVRLGAPLGQRELTGSAASEHGVFKGALLVRPSWLPTGWRLAGSGSGTEESWARTWFPRAQPPTDGSCTPSETGLGLTQGSPGLVRPLVMENVALANQQAVATNRVHGEDATYFLDPKRSATLLWTEGKRALALQTISACNRDTLATVDTMLRFARSLT